MNTLNEKRAAHARLMVQLDEFLKANPTLRSHTEETSKQLSALCAQIIALAKDIQAAPLEVCEIIELNTGRHERMHFMVRTVDETDPDVLGLRFLTGHDFLSFHRDELDAIGFKRLGKWSGYGPPPPIGTRILVIANALGPATVVEHEIRDGFLGLRVRFHQPPGWWRRQNQDHSTLGLVFGAEIRW